MNVVNPSRTLAQRVAHEFRAPVPVLIAYGSAVKTQHGQSLSDETSMVDLIFGVDDAVAWHDANLAQHRSHYATLMGLAGARAIAWVQSLGAGVYYNTLVPFHGRTIKYGVVTVDRLQHELRRWDDFYLSGRLQKPIDVVQSTADFDKALDINRTNALHTALLLLPAKFTQIELYMRIAGLSYAGDFRMVYGENPHKVSNIVKGQYDDFVNIYQPLLRQIAPTTVDSSGHDSSPSTIFHQDMDPETIAHRLAVLPSNFQLRVQGYWERSKGHGMTHLRDIAVDPNRAEYILKALHAINGRSSRVQSIKGIVTAGFVKSVQYVRQKLNKRAKALKP